MNRIFILLFFSLSQFVLAQKINWGIGGGASFANLYDHNSNGNEIPNAYISTPSSPPPTSINPNYQTGSFSDLRTGFFIEVFGNRDISKMWNVKIGLAYTQKGIKLNYHLRTNSTNPDNSTTIANYQYNRDFLLGYLAMPIDFRYFVSENHRFYVLGGIYHSIALNFKIKNSSSQVTQETFSSSGQPMGKSIDMLTVSSAYANRFDAGLKGGFGFEYRMGSKWRIAAEIQGLLGLIPVPRNYNKYGFLNFDRDSKNISFETGVKITRWRN